jgi:hypothetical protein
LNWKAALKNYNLDYFKASELSAGEGQFKQYRDDPLCTKWKPFSAREARKFTEIKIAFTEVIAGFSTHLNAIGAVVVLPDYDKIKRDYPPANTLAYPYYLAGQVVMMEAGLQITKENENIRGDQIYLRPVFDSHEEYSGRMKGMFDSFCQKNPLSARHMLPPHYEDDRLYLSLQVADNLAFEIRKYALSTLGSSNRPMRKSLERIQSAFVRVYRLDYDGLKTIADAQDSDFNPLDPITYTVEDIIGAG